MENWHEEHVGRARSLRGGSWYNYEYLLGRSGRVYLSPGYRYNVVGFRVVCSQS
jgi:formylglycine-generating enzyme required for sulfatase activity